MYILLIPSTPNPDQLEMGSRMGPAVIVHVYMAGCCLCSCGIGTYFHLGGSMWLAVSTLCVCVYVCAQTHVHKHV